MLLCLLFFVAVFFFFFFLINFGLFSFLFLFFNMYISFFFGGGECFVLCCCYFCFVFVFVYFLFLWGGGERMVRWYFYIYVCFGPFFGFKILNFNIYWRFRKLNILRVLRNCGYFCDVITKHDYLEDGRISMHFRYRMKYLLGVAKNQNLFGYVWYFFLYWTGINSSCWVQA